MNVDSGSLGRPSPGATQLAVGFGQPRSFQLSDCAPDPAKLCQPKGWYTVTREVVSVQIGFFLHRSAHNCISTIASGPQEQLVELGLVQGSNPAKYKQFLSDTQLCETETSVIANTKEVATTYICAQKRKALSLDWGISHSAFHIKFLLRHLLHIPEPDLSGLIHLTSYPSTYPSLLLYENGNKKESPDPFYRLKAEAQKGVCQDTKPAANTIFLLKHWTTQVESGQILCS
ncbi:hypothetical protein Anapl_00293 [Anas platyrhynchos]|uniref:Uncharacterized protein n=1 Tax=Anas platyrhynchos TaxID=8839 RepID=R0M1T8_ANAPL|nr:hypothetical protein Anapl_00293 [Anas platyrhynchos]